LTEQGVEFETVDYLKKESLSESKLKHLLRAAGLKPQEAIRKNELAYQQYVATQSLTDDQLIRVMAEHPELIQRPIVTRGTKAVLARPSEKLTDLGIT
jgi:arsenate reductase